MRVLLVQSYLGRKGVADQLVFPIGLSCIASALARAGHEPWIIDLNVGADPFVRLRDELRRFKPELVGVSLRNIDSVTRKAPYIYHTQLSPTLEVIRAEAPHAKTVLGGPGFTQSSRGFMERYASDFGCQSEGEHTIVALIDALDAPSSVPGLYWRDRDGAVHFTGDPVLPEFSELPFPDRSFVDWDLYRAEEESRGLFLDIGVESTRGCPRKCAYCNYPYLNGVKLRRKPPEVVVDEIDDLIARFGVRQLTFTDSRFNENTKHARAICEELLRRDVKVRWIAWLGFRRISGEFLRLMQRAGCFRVAFSPDGLLQPSLDRMRKEMKTEEVFASIRAVREAPGLKASWSFFCTPPSTTNTEQVAMLGTYAYIHAALPGRGRMMLNWCRIEEHTHFEHIAREDGVLTPDIDLLPDTPAQLDRVFYVPRGFDGWSRFWDRFLDAEMAVRVAAGRATGPLRRVGMRVPDLTPAHLRGAPGR